MPILRSVVAMLRGRQEPKCGRCGRLRGVKMAKCGIEEIKKKRNDGRKKEKGILCAVGSQVLDFV